MVELLCTGANLRVHPSFPKNKRAHFPPGFAASSKGSFVSGRGSCEHRAAAKVSCWPSPYLSRRMARLGEELSPTGQKPGKRGKRDQARKGLKGKLRLDKEKGNCLLNDQMRDLERLR